MRAIKIIIIITIITIIMIIMIFFCPPCVVQSEQQRELTQIQYLAWPDHGVPDDSTDFLDFVALVRTKRAGQDQPMVVHCRWESSLALCDRRTDERIHF